jgi:hypothetical protein
MHGLKKQKAIFILHISDDGSVGLDLDDSGIPGCPDLSQGDWIDNMELLVAEYPDVDFVFMTGHAEGQGEGGFIYAANQQIRQHCIDKLCA